MAHAPGYQYVNEVSGPIEPYRAMPLLANDNTLNANGLAARTPEFWGNSWEFGHAKRGVAADCVEEAIAGKIAGWRDIPKASRAARGKRLIPAPAQMAAR